MDEILERQDRIIERASSRIPESGLECMDINAYLASLTEFCNSPLMRIIGNERMKKSIGMYAFIRDKYGAKTYGEAVRAISGRKIDSKIIQLWVEEGMLVSNWKAAIRGYPEYRQEIERERDEAV